MRHLLAIVLAVGVLTALACGGSSVENGTCSERGATCVGPGSNQTCKESLPYPCPQGGQCCIVN